MARIVFLSCHLTGTGHLVRTLTLAKAGLDRGHDVTIISGGRPLAHIDTEPVPLVQLAAVTVHDLDYSTLRTETGETATETFLAERRKALEDQFVRLMPDVLITELFPFGRRMLAGEFLGAIATVRAGDPSALVLCSVRDAPEPKPHRIDEAAERLRLHFDGVLVHGDCMFLPLDETWPLPSEVRPKLHYTGYVGRPMPPPGSRRRYVLVSTGGGALGRQLLDLAAEAARESQLPWHVLVGGADAAEIAADLSTRASADNLTVEPARPDYRDLLAGAGCSVSLCGYNTSVELASCETPAILVPSEEAGEREQLIRARRLAGFEGIALHRLHDLTPERLCENAELLASGPRRPKIPLTIDDGRTAIAQIETLLSDRPL